jgi:ribonuclease E
VLDVMPSVISVPEPESPPEPEVALVASPVAAPAPEIDVAALIADDPNQIVAPPEKPKRGWWRR